MRNDVQIELIEFERLMGKFSTHVQRPLVAMFCEHYKMLLNKSHLRFPQNKVILKKLAKVTDLEQRVLTDSPSDMKLIMQAHIVEIVKEMDKVNENARRAGHMDC